MGQEREFTEFEDHLIDLGKWGKFLCKKIVPEERTIAGEWTVTYGDAPIPATLIYVPLDEEEEKKLLNNPKMQASDFLHLDWYDWTVRSGNKEVNKGDERDPELIEVIYMTDYEIKEYSYRRIDLRPYGDFEFETMRLYNNWNACLCGIWHPSELAIDKWHLPYRTRSIRAELYFTMDKERTYDHVSDGYDACWKKWDDIKPIGEPLELIEYEPYNNYLDI